MIKSPENVWRGWRYKSACKAILTHANKGSYRCARDIVSARSSQTTRHLSCGCPATAKTVAPSLDPSLRLFSNLQTCNLQISPQLVFTCSATDTTLRSLSISCLTTYEVLIPIAWLLKSRYCASHRHNGYKNIGGWLAAHVHSRRKCHRRVQSSLFKDIQG